MSGLSWQRGPLSEEVEDFLNKRAPGSGWKRALENWNRLGDIFCNIDTRKIFVPRLSTSQSNSYRLLIEWWTGEYQDAALSSTARLAIRHHAQGHSPDERVPPNMKLEKSHYNKQLFELFQYEFFFYGKSTAAPIQLRRQKAALIAACQRAAQGIGRTLCPQYAGELLDRSTNETYLKSATEVHQLAQASRDFFTTTMGAIIEPCPWLPFEKKHSWPHYLWDIEGKQIVVVSDLADRPEYAIVSHTWGRWRLPGRGIKIATVPWNVPENEKFKVEELPETLLRHRSAFFPNCYVWLDLLCIPQDRSPLATLEISRQAAIFGNAAMAVAWLNDIDSWESIQAAVQWLALTFAKNTSQDFDGVGPLLSDMEKKCATTTQLYEKYIHTEGNLSVGQKPNGWFTSLWTLQEACLRPEMKICNREWQMLRLEASQDSLPLTLDGILALCDWFQQDPGLTYHMPPAVIEILSLLQHTSLTQILKCSPLAVLVLGDRRECTGRRAEAIMAVMGAAEWYGKGHSHDHDLEDNLVLEKFPLAFLQEIQQNLGAEFFSSVYATCCFWDIFEVSGTETVDQDEGRGERDGNGDDGGGDSEGEQDSELEEMEHGSTTDRSQTESETTEICVVGTMLPFGLSSANAKITGSADSSMRIDHPATKTWTVLNDGRVLMPEAGIAVSTDAALDADTDQELLALAFGPRSKEPPRWMVPSEDAHGNAGHVNLHTWLQESFPGVPKHAVCVKYSEDGWSQGVILMGIIDGEEGKGIFAKLGDYFTSAHGGTFAVPRSQKVDWEVL